MNNQTAAYYAVKTLIDNGINELPVTDDKIIEMINNEGYTVISYNYPLTESDLKDFSELGLVDTAKKYVGFTYCNSTVNYVFYRTTLSVSERTKVLAHELGHIRQRHILPNRVMGSMNFKSNHPQELEADAFAIELIAPTCILKRIPFLTPQKISHITLLAHSDAENIFFKIRNFHFLTNDEKILRSRFFCKNNLFKALTYTFHN